MKNTNFFILPNNIFESKMPATAFIVFCYLVRCKNKDNKCFPSIQNISKAVGVSKSTVCSALKYLLDNKIIEREHNFKYGRQTNNEYKISDFMWSQTVTP